MATSAEEPSILTSRMRIRPESNLAFADWQAKFNAVIAAFPGFISLEFLFPGGSNSDEWIISQRFQHSKEVEAWRSSNERKLLIDELKHYLVSDQAHSFQEEETYLSKHQGGVTEVFVTQVSPDQESAYKEWIAKMHQVEAKFPGFRGVYVQSPTYGQGRSWITMLQFDTPENLDKWLSSPEREEVLKRSKSLIKSLESHRVISPYAGWFSSIAQTGVPIAVWKQTMIILLVLFPIVMLEFKFLNPWTAQLNLSLATFIGNAISVSLVSWPMMPIAIYFLSWWLAPSTNKRQASIIGTFVVLGLYLLEIILLWKLI